jgi:uncharacterized protein (TIGR02246 family)
MTAATTVADLEELHAGILASWNRRDAAAYARHFCDDAIVIGFDGSEMHGRDEIAEQLAAIFADHVVATYVRLVRGVRELCADAALLHAVVGMVPPGGDDVMPDRHAVQLLVARRVDGAWRALSLQNTPVELHGRPEAIEALTEELRTVLRRAGGS